MRRTCSRRRASFDDLAAAVAGASYVAALSGRPRPARAARDVREMAAEVAALDAADTAALVFGPETTGLTHAELALCGRAVRIPSHPAQPSLNLSHAVAIAAYEVFRAGRPAAPAAAARDARGEGAHAGPAARGPRGRAAPCPRRTATGFFEDWRALFQRADLTPKEVRLLEHMARKMARRG